MYICTKCSKEMVCKKNGVIARWGESCCRAGDKYICKKCGNEILACNINSFESTRKINPDILLQMD